MIRHLWSCGAFLLGALVLLAPGPSLYPSTQTHPFKEVARSAGIDFGHQNSPTSQKYLLEITGSGVALLDYDGDGWLDIYFVNGARLEDPMPARRRPDKRDPRFWNRLYRNLQDGTYQDVTEEAGVKGEGYGMGAAVGDFDNDGDPDLYVTNFGPNLLYRNNGDKTFSDVTTSAATGDPRWSASAAFFDYDRDGFLDLYVTNYVDFRFDNNTFCGDKQAGYRTYCHPGVFSGAADRLYRNNGDGTFSDLSKATGVAIPEGQGLGVVSGDYDLDGYQDIYVANDSLMNFLYRGGPDHKFEEVSFLTNVGYSGDGQAQAGMGTDLGDYNGDGFPDLVVTNLSFEGTTLYRNERDGSFADVSIQAGLQDSRLLVGFGMRFLDFDNDGDLDLFTVNGHVVDNVHLYRDVLTFRQPKQLYENEADKFLNWGERAGPPLNTPRVGRGAAFGDVDNDGDVDVVVANCGGPGELLLNQAGNGQNWLQTRLIGTRSNRDAVGARLILKVGEKTLHRQKKGGSSYLAAHDPRVHFGLGSANRVDSLEVFWPSGERQVLRDLEVDRVITVTEPAAKAAGRK